MRRLKFAFRAFMAIMMEKPHAFVSGRYHSLNGKRNDVERFRDTITEIWNDQVYQANLVEDAKKILEGAK